MCDVWWDRHNVLIVAAELGGFLGTAYIITSTFLSSYLSFKYHISIMRRLYHEEIAVGDD